MKHLLASAPGKLMIAGEYAVLFGTPAIVAAIDRTAQCTFAPGDHFEFLARTSPCAALESPPLFEAVIKTCEKGGFKAQAGRYVIDTSAFFSESSGQKLGLGSSAAAVVALVKIILLQHDRRDSATIFDLAFHAHRNFSLGLGSGADVAASTFGGIITFQQQAPTFNIAHLDFMGPFETFMFIDTKRPEDSRAMVKGVFALNEKDPAFMTEFCKASADLCGRLKHAREEAVVIQVIEEFYRSFKELGLQAHLNIISSAHETIHEVAQCYGGSAKPSGAGGGDFSMAVVPTTERTRFLKKIRDLGFRPMNFLLR